MVCSAWWEGGGEGYEELMKRLACYPAAGSPISTQQNAKPLAARRQKFMAFADLQLQKKKATLIADRRQKTIGFLCEIM